MDEQEKLYETTADDIVNDSSAYGQEDTMDSFGERIDDGTSTSDDTVGMDDTTVGDRSLDSDSLGGDTTTDSALTDDGFREKMPMGDDDDISSDTSSLESDKLDDDTL